MEPNYIITDPCYARYVAGEMNLQEVVVCQLTGIGTGILTFGIVLFVIFAIVLLFSAAIVFTRKNPWD